MSKFTQCQVVRHGDRLGLYFEQAPGAVSYTFDASDPMVSHSTKVTPPYLLVSRILIELDRL